MFRRSLFEEMANMFRSFDSLFRQSFEDAGWPTGQRLLPSAGSDLPTTTSSWGGSSFPAVEALTRDDQLVLRVELPGVTPDDVDVSVVGNRLTICGEKKSERESDEDNYFIREIHRGRFERTFTLPEGAQADQVAASYENGVLEITVPAKGLLPETRKIPVKALGGGKRTTKVA